MSVDIGGEKSQSEEEKTLITCVFSICYTLYTIATALRLMSNCQRDAVFGSHFLCLSLISLLHISNNYAVKEPVMDSESFAAKYILHITASFTRLNLALLNDYLHALLYW